MAKKVGEIDEETGRFASKKMRRVREVDWPVTIVDTRAKRIKRSLWG